eukprot:CAMPEP_0185745780 /NCGR_PEP_ID=MMETSP1174-20130828/4150_1 /TAXON_ID=35687 /ORGANISM="Dictyocha speculum, Strain CCMP1381" /LENGTH=743 /DNA_ID=CAMNT_0028419989 /DNA_START=18 /DNA_END=2249 /DNA_ORIENTATION=+
MEQWNFLVSGKTLNPKKCMCPAPDTKGGWIDTRMWDDLLNLSGLDEFAGFEEDFSRYLPSWQSYYDNTEPHLMQLPGKWDEKLGSFARLLVLRSLRPDRIPEAVMNFVSETMGQRFVEPPPFHLPSCFEDATIITPLVFVLSKGSDPTKSFYEFAKEKGMERRVTSLSLGQGQGEKAKAMIKQGTAAGTWVYLQNCHLFISWLVTLEQICEEFSPETVHKEFRLWLTSMPTPKFPVAILQTAVKMTNEPPKGLKANLKNAYFKLDNAKLDRTAKPDAYKKLLFSLCFFHAIVQERRKFGPLGWNVPYEFNDTDLDISLGQLEMFLDQYETIPYRVLVFLTSYINYGGRVTDYIDLRTIDIVMRDFFRAEVLDDFHQFDKSGVYISPPYDPADPHKSYTDYVDSLPLVAGPTVFGLHENANIACAMTETFGMFATLLSLESKASGGSSGAREEMIGATAASIEERLNAKGLFDIEGIRLQYPVTYSESMNTVLVQESIRYNKLIVEMQTSLPLLQKALKGLVVLSSELEAMCDAFAANTVPLNWETRAYPSMKPLSSWANDLIERLEFIIAWIDHGVRPVYWISGLYFPQGFLTGTLQNSARKLQIPIDSVTFDFVVIEEAWEKLQERPADGAYIRGLFMEGARWDSATHSVNDSRPKQLFSTMPVLHLVPVQDRPVTTDGVYQLPVYKVLSRRGVLMTTGHSTNFIMWIEIPSNRKSVLNQSRQTDQEEWIKAGVAAFCSLKY